MKALDWWAVERCVHCNCWIADRGGGFDTICGIICNTCINPIPEQLDHQELLRLMRRKNVVTVRGQDVWVGKDRLERMDA